MTPRLTAKLLLASSVLLLSSRSAFTQTAPALNATSQTDTDEPSSHEGRWRRSIEADLVAEKFDELDRMADTYRRDKTRLPGGDWRLHVMYEVLDAPQLTDKDSADHLAHLQHWMKLRPESITARVALATSLHRWAWVARGNGLARTVTDEGWRLFNERIKESQIVLEGSRDMKVMCPQWYSEMMTVGLAQNWDARQMKEAFDRAVQFEPEYQYFYRQYANYLLPKWDGEPGDASKFAKSSADRLGGDRGDMLYFEIGTVLIKRGNGNFQPKEMDWERLQHGYRALVAQSGATRHNENQFAFMAYKFRDTNVARQQFAMIGDDWARGVWREKQFFDRARDWSQNKTAWP